jgi:ELWxxDGT repeat protein
MALELVRRQRRLVAVLTLVLAPSSSFAATIAPAHLVEDIHPGAGSSQLASLTTLGDVLYFVADDGVHGFELWRSDGSAEGTWLVKDIAAGPDNGLGPFNWRLVVLNDRLYFAADDGSGGAQLWSSDGSEEGTVRIVDLSGDRILPTLLRLLVEYDGALFFMITTGSFSTVEGSPRGSDVLWSSDGTDAGTVPLTQLGTIEPGPFGGYRSVTALRPSQGRLLALIREQFECCWGLQLLVIDPAMEARTVYSSSLFPPFVGGPYEIGGVTELGTDLLLVAPEGASYGYLACRLLITSSNPPTILTPARALSCDTELVRLGESVFFTDDFEGSFALWATDGTVEGTQPVATFGETDIASGLALADSTLFFSTHDSTLWVSDGTPTGTRAVRRFRADTGIAIRPRAVGDTVLFAADDGTGAALWKSNGAASGTAVIQRPPDSGGVWNLSQLAVTESTVFFVADDFEHGKELWAMPSDSLSAACVGDCDGDRNVTVDELVKGTMIDLGELVSEQCSSFDANLDATVTVDELGVGITAALLGCG